MIHVGDTVIFEEQRCNNPHGFIPEMTGVIRGVRRGEALVEFTSGPRDGELCVFPVGCFDDPN